MGVKEWVLGLTVVGTAGEYGIARYFFHQIAIQGDAKRDRTQRTADTDQDAYIPGTRTNREWLAGQPQEEVYIASRDGLRLHGTSFCCEGSGKAVVCFHGCTSEGLSDYISIVELYLSQGLSLMAVDERAHGKSEGTYIGFDCLDRNDAKQWMEYMVERLGGSCELVLHSISMGAATVLISTGLNLPERVRATMSDCTFTSVQEVFSHVFRSTYYTPAFPVMQIADRMARSEAGYGLDEYNARGEVKRARIPILFTYGDKDTFVPCSMVYELYKACTSPKELSVMPGASHAEAYYKETDRHEHVIEELVTRFFRKEEDKV